MNENLRILWVDDDRPMLGQLIAGVSQNSSSLELHTAYSYREAIEQLNELAPDLVVLDVELNEEKDGFDLIEVVQEYDPSISIIMVSSHGDLKTIAKALKLGAKDFIVKNRDYAAMAARFIEVGKRRLVYLQISSQLENLSVADGFLFSSPAMKKLQVELAQVIKNPRINIMLRGETGVGKEIVARFINKKTGNDRALIDINCAALSESLADSELFGHEKGAFTGAHSARPGKIEIAHNGDLFLDEIGKMPKSLQGKLLRVIETKEITRLGSNRKRHSNFRVIAASNENFEQLIKGGHFLLDLYKRLSGYVVTIPPLRERKKEIIPLAKKFAADALGREVKIPQEVERTLLAQSWPGNIRDLKNLVQLLASKVQGDVLLPSFTPEMLDELITPAPLHRRKDDKQGFTSIAIDLTLGLVAAEGQVFRAFFESAVKACGKKPTLIIVSKMMGLKKSTLADRMKELNLNFKN